MANIVKILWSKITGRVPSSLADGQIAINQKDKILFYPDENGVIQSFPFAALGGANVVSGNANFNFLKEDDTVLVTILSAVITNANFKTFIAIPLETSDTSFEDFALNGLTFSIENIIDNISFSIRATAQNQATGVFSINYKITY